jgi:NAD(P)H dehydrogenase (quinone)
LSMKKVLVLYYSRTGNTEKMANAVAEGLQSGGVEVELNYHIDAKNLVVYDAILVGSPTYHHDMPIEFKNLFEQAAVEGLNLKGKIGAVFGSYGWSGEAPKLILEIMKNKFDMQVIELPLLSKYTPDQTIVNTCRELGKRVSESLMNQA